MTVFPCSCQIGHCVLCEAYLFSGLEGTQVCAIQGIISKRSYQAHDILFRARDLGKHLFLVKEGQVKLTTSLPDGREQILGVRVAGQLLGFETLDDQLYPYTAKALSKVDVCMIRYHDMVRVLEQNPKVSMRVIKLLNQELEHSQALIRDLGLKSASEKVASFIISLIPTRGPATDTLPLLLSRQEIADMLGLTVETVSRTMAEFKRAGLIKTPRRLIHILDPHGLRELAGVADDSDPRYLRVMPA